jgi:hypothetical protein
MADASDTISAPTPQRENSQPDAELLAAYERLAAVWDHDADKAGAANEQVRDLPARTIVGAVVKLQAALLTRGGDYDDDGRAMLEALRALEADVTDERRRLDGMLAMLGELGARLDALAAAAGVRVGAGSN